MRGRVFTLACASALCLAASAAVYSQQAAADLVLTGGKIITVDEKFTIAQAIGSPSRMELACI